MKNFDLIKNHLADNTGDENISKMIWIVIVFVVGAALLVIFSGVFAEDGVFNTYLGNAMDSWFADEAVSRPSING